MSIFLPLLLALFWGLVIAITRFSSGRKTISDHPIVLLLLPQIFAIALIPNLQMLGLVTPAVSMEVRHFLFLVCASSLITMGMALGARGKRRVLPKMRNNTNSLPFWICFWIGGFGTFMLLSNLGAASPRAFITLVTTDFNTLEQDFFNSSYAILWQACIAAFFWFNTVKQPTLAMKIALGLLIIFVFARGALLYIIIAVSYYLISYIYMRPNAHFPLKPVLLFLSFTQVVFLLSYTFEGNAVQIYFEKTYPYLSGNFVNLFRHIDLGFANSVLIPDSMDNTLQAMGLSSIWVYLDRYLGWEFSPDLRMIFYLQTKNAYVYGNTHTLYGQLLYLPVMLFIPFVFALGLLIGGVYRLAAHNLFWLSVHCWMSAATFLSFAGAGHFTTTRFFPALLFIWPFLLLLALAARRKPSARTLQAKRGL